MAIEKQISVFLENRPGRLAELCGLLAKEKINIRAFTVHEQADTSVVRMVTGSMEKVRTVLTTNGIAFSEADVLALKMPNAPGALHRVARQLAAAKVNIEYAYGTAGRAGARGECVFRVSHLERAKKAVGG